MQGCPRIEALAREIEKLENQGYSRAKAINEVFKRLQPEREILTPHE